MIKDTADLVFVTAIVILGVIALLVVIFWPLRDR